MTSNVIVFPKFNIREGEYPQSLEEVQNKVTSVKYSHIAEILGPLVDFLENQLLIGGFDDPNNQCSKDWALVVFALESFMAKTYNIQNKFQYIADAIFIDDPQDPESWTIANKVEIDFEKEA